MKLESAREIARITLALAELIEPDGIPPWWVRSSEAFHGRKPVDVVEDGDSWLIWEMISLMKSGEPLS